jgi:hypothetical protein
MEQSTRPLPDWVDEAQQKEELEWELQIIDENEDDQDDDYKKDEDDAPVLKDEDCEDYDVENDELLTPSNSRAIVRSSGGYHSHSTSSN